MVGRVVLVVKRLRMMSHALLLYVYIYVCLQIDIRLSVARVCTVADKLNQLTAFTKLFSRMGIAANESPGIRPLILAVFCCIWHNCSVQFG